MEQTVDTLMTIHNGQPWSIELRHEEYFETPKESLGTSKEAECLQYYPECVKTFLSIENSTDHG